MFLIIIIGFFNWFFLLFFLLLFVWHGHYSFFGGVVVSLCVCACVLFACFQNIVL